MNVLRPTIAYFEAVPIEPTAFQLLHSFGRVNTSPSSPASLTSGGSVGYA
jgi:hypothetical protein